MKLAIIGAGMIVGDFLKVAKEISEIKLISILSTKRSEEKVKILARENNIKKVVTDYDDILKDEEVDTVYIALPNNLHYEYSKKALLSGKNVICEKPFTLYLKELEELVKIANDKNLILIEAITNQYLENFYCIKENIPRLGDIKIVSCNYSQYSSRYDNFKQGIIAPAFDVKKGGGALLDLNIYNIHLVVGLFGKSLSAKYLGNIEKEVDTSGVLTMNYDDKVVVCIGSKDCSAKITTTIQGTKGYITIYGGTNTLDKVTITLNDGTEEVYFNKNEHRMYNEFVKFVDVIKNKDTDFSKKMLINSLDVMRVIEQTRK